MSQKYFCINFYVALSQKKSPTPKCIFLSNFGLFLIQNNQGINNLAITSGLNLQCEILRNRSKIKTEIWQFLNIKQSKHLLLFWHDRTDFSVSERDGAKIYTLPKFKMC